MDRSDHERRWVGRHSGRLQRRGRVGKLLPNSIRLVLGCLVLGVLAVILLRLAIRLPRAMVIVVPSPSVTRRGREGPRGRPPAGPGPGGHRGGATRSPGHRGKANRRSLMRYPSRRPPIGKRNGLFRRGPCLTSTTTLPRMRPSAKASDVVTEIEPISMELERLVGRERFIAGGVSPPVKSLPPHPHRVWHGRDGANRP
jgi:hypothetical protein